MNTPQDIPVETHPWEPFVPEGARVLIMGTFPPAPKRWSMDFYYPNRTNDFWRIMGLIYCGDPLALYDAAARTYRLDDIRALLTRHHIALSDTGRRVRRLAGNASDKYLDIVEPVDLAALLRRMPGCRAVATTGEKAAGVVAALTGTEVPRMGCRVDGPDGIAIDFARLSSGAGAQGGILCRDAPLGRCLKNLNPATSCRPCA